MKTRMFQGIQDTLLAVIFGLMLPTGAGAVIINPDPGNFGPDDGSTSFTPQAQMFALEAFDALTTINAGFQIYFGFYRVADPAGTATIIFDPLDQAAAIPDQTAFVDFISGSVLDLDGGASSQSTFVAGLGDIGFGFAIDSLGLVYATDPALNGGIDFFASFPSLTNPLDYMLGVEIPDGNGGLVTVYLATVSGVTGSSSTVPEPSTLMLLLAGSLVGGGIQLCRKQKRS